MDLPRGKNGIRAEVKRARVQRLDEYVRECPFVQIYAFNLDNFILFPDFAFSFIGPRFRDLQTFDVL